jgi:methionyl-tRNA formyltransferase
MRYVALGRTSWLYDSIDRLQTAGHDLVYLVTAPAAPEYGVTAQDFVELGSRYGVRTDTVKGRLSVGIVERLVASQADVAISVNWPTLIDPNVRGIFRHGVLNAHAGDLPLYRGNAAPNWAILLGESQVVVTVHEMDDGLDAGPIYLKRAIAIDDKTYIGDIYSQMSVLIPEMFAEVLNGLRDGGIVAAPQPSDPGSSLRAFPRLPEDAEVDWADSAQMIAALVRASSSPFAGAYTWKGADKLTIWRAHAEAIAFPHVGYPGQVIKRDSESGTVHILTGDGALAIEEASVGVDPPDVATEVIRSSRTRLHGAPRNRYVLRR